MTTLNPTAMIIMAIITRNEPVLARVFRNSDDDPLSLVRVIHKEWEDFWRRGVSKTSQEMLAKAGIEEADELVSEVYSILISRDEDTLKAIDDVFSYTRRIAHNRLIAAVDMKRHKKLYTRIASSRSLDQPASPGSETSYGEVLDSQQIVPDDLSHEQCEKRLWTALKTLDPRARKVFCLSVVEGRKSAEIAAELRTTPGNVDTIKHRAKKRVQAQYRELYMD